MGMFFFSFLRKTFFLPVAVAVAFAMRLLLARRFLLGDRCAAWPFACARICMCPLAAHWQPATMPQSAIRANVHQALDVHLDTLSQIAFDFALFLDHRADTAEIVLTKIPDPDVDVYSRFIQDRR